MMKPIWRLSKTPSALLRRTVWSGELPNLYQLALVSRNSKLTSLSVCSQVIHILFSGIIKTCARGRKDLYWWPPGGDPGLWRLCSEHWYSCYAKYVLTLSSQENVYWCCKLLPALHRIVIVHVYVYVRFPCIVADISCHLSRLWIRLLYCRPVRIETNNG